MAVYTPSRTWAPGVAGGTLIRAIDLNHIEQGVVEVSQDVEDLRTDVADNATDISNVSAQVAQIRDSINKGATPDGQPAGNGTITSVNGYPGPIVILTKSDIGLDKVNNTADTAKPVSTAMQSALDAKAPLNSPAFTGNVTGINKASVGLSNVDNTADADKPVSTATQYVLSQKAPLANPTFTGTVNGITKSMVGLGSVDNTADLDKFNSYGVLPKIYYNGTSWASRAVPTGYNGAVEWNSELYANVSAPPAAIDNDRWARKRS